MTDAEIKAYLKRIGSKGGRRSWETRTEAQRKEALEKMAEGRRRKFRAMSDDERRAHGKRLGQRSWESKSPEERQKAIERMAEGRRRKREERAGGAGAPPPAVRDAIVENLTNKTVLSAFRDAAAAGVRELKAPQDLDEEDWIP